MRTKPRPLRHRLYGKRGGVCDSSRAWCGWRRRRSEGTGGARGSLRDPGDARGSLRDPGCARESLRRSRGSLRGFRGSLRESPGCSGVCEGSRGSLRGPGVPSLPPAVAAAPSDVSLAGFRGGQVPRGPGEAMAGSSSRSPSAERDPGPAAPSAEQALLRAGLALPERPGALPELGALLEAAEPRWLRGSEGSAALGRLAAALAGLAAPPRREQDGAEPPGRDAALAAVAERAERVGAAFLLLLQKLEDARSQQSPGTAAAGPVPRRVLGHAFIFAVTHKEERPWTTARSRAVAQELLERLVRAAGCGSVEEFLRGKEEDEEGRFGEVMGLLKQELTKDTWKCNPASKDVFSWSLLRVSRPWLCPHLERVLPPALLLSDDFQEENKVLGVRCLHHIVLNVPGADLCQFNRAQVVFHALYNHLYSREAPLIQAVLLCLLDLLPVLERCQRRQGHGRATSPWDQVLQLVLTHMEAEHQLALRRVYAGTLPAFVTRLGILIARHLKRLERVILGYLEVSDGPGEEARLGILETLQCTIEHAWPRMPCRLPVLLKALLRLLWDVHTERGPTPEPVKAALLHRATQCLILLDRCCQGQVKVSQGSLGAARAPWGLPGAGQGEPGLPGGCQGQVKVSQGSLGLPGPGQGEPGLPGGCQGSLGAARARSRCCWQGCTAAVRRASCRSASGRCRRAPEVPD
ncbi:TELO2-interacting protein 2 isoform X8 [Serinus canaria]|uniref:TELO2-interacting protein 2 isoform X7 n=1 Tax=Serinus canaria TaxID=9135 RepID=UPI0021CD0DB2|nr:TELO2-interacting protein 2 isoform X7 [Serinus canaria]XP_050838840.1 TELO2-interacting protein 2 isoform X8 [Serinus canaria]